METNGKFWAGMVVFQVAFGRTVFGATRAYYADDATATAAAGAAPNPATVRQRPAPQPGGISANDIALSSAMTMPTDNPAEMGRQADMLFREQQYDRAAELYARLMELEPGNVYTFTANLRIENPDRDSEDFGGISINETATTGTHLQRDIAFLAIRRNGGAQATTVGEARIIDIPAGTYAVDRSEGHELAIAIDTSDEDWTVVYEIDGDEIGQRVLRSREPGTYYLNIGQYDSTDVVFESIALLASEG